jgi:hypothetical protein
LKRRGDFAQRAADRTPTFSVAPSVRCQDYCPAPLRRQCGRQGAQGWRHLLRLLRAHEPSRLREWAVRSRPGDREPRTGRAKAHLLAPDVIKTAVEAYGVERVRLSREAAKTRAFLERELAEINRKTKWLIREIENGRGSAKVSDRLCELETREEAVKSQLALANGLDLVELHPQAAERYAAKVADIHAALARGDAAGHEAINLVCELITRVRVIPPRGASRSVLTLPATSPRSLARTTREHW